MMQRERAFTHSVIKLRIVDSLLEPETEVKLRVLVDPVPHLGTAIHRAQYQTADATVAGRRSRAVVEVSLCSLLDPGRMLPPRVGALLRISQKNRIAGALVSDVLVQRQIVILKHY